MVTSGDYTVWRKNFAKTPFGGAGAGSVVVPELSSAPLLVIGCVAVGIGRRKRRG
jgi:hypothetical protein